jgi:hypothetical protein
MRNDDTESELLGKYLAIIDIIRETVGERYGDPVRIVLSIGCSHVSWWAGGMLLYR